MIKQTSLIYHYNNPDEFGSSEFLPFVFKNHQEFKREWEKMPDDVFRKDKMKKKIHEELNNKYDSIETKLINYIKQRTLKKSQNKSEYNLPRACLHFVLLSNAR